jgi:hypothetical protein
MGSILRGLGLTLLAATACLLVADALGWIPPGIADPWLSRGLYASLSSLGAGLALGLLAPVGREIRRGRCARCGRRIERRQTYCRDHLRATLDEYRDQARHMGSARRPPVSS